MTKIAVIGSLNLDLIVQTTRLPVPGETVMGSEIDFRAGGKGANQAVAVRRYGADVCFLGATGDDDFGERLLAALGEAGVDTEHVLVLPGMASGVASITVDSEGENTIVVVPGANWALTPNHVEVLVPFLATADALLMQLEIPIAATLRAAHLAHEVGTAVVLNAAPLPDPQSPELAELLRTTDVLLVNETEALALGATGSTWTGRARSLMSRGPQTVIATLGALGAAVAHREGSFFQPAFPVEAINAVGAGDAFSASLTVELARGTSLAESVRRACAAGALATTGAGAQNALPSLEQVSAYLETLIEGVGYVAT
jgi:ribokinase